MLGGTVEVPKRTGIQIWSNIWRLLRLCLGKGMTNKRVAFPGKKHPLSTSYLHLRAHRNTLNPTWPCIGSSPMRLFELQCEIPVIKKTEFRQKRGHLFQEQDSRLRREYVNHKSHGLASCFYGSCRVNLSHGTSLPLWWQLWRVADLKSKITTL